MTIGFDLGHDLDLEFSRSNMEFPISQPKMVRLPRNEKQTYRWNSRAQMWPLGLTLAMTLTLNFQGQIWNFLYLSQKWFDYHETKSKHIDWTLRIKCDHRVWPWPWPWPWLFKVKYGISYSNISTELQASNVTKRFDLDLDLFFFFGGGGGGGAIDIAQRVGSRSWPWQFGDQGQVYGSTR